VLVLSIVVGCGGSEEGPRGAPPRDTGAPTTDTRPPDTTDTRDDTGGAVRDCAEARIGASGGQVQLYDVLLQLPPGALDQDADVTLCVADPPGGVVPVSTVVEVGPPTMELLLAATVTINHTGDPLATGLFVPDPTGAPVRQVAATTEEQRVSGPLYRPGVVYAAEDPRALVPYVIGGVADVLFVVDDSCSMADEQAQLASDMDVILHELLDNKVDFHLGVVTTDIDAVLTAGELRQADGVKWVEPTTPNPGQVFSAMVNAGTLGSGTEKGLGAAYIALEEKEAVENAGFLRPDAMLAVVVLSDEEDATPASVITQPDFVDWFDRLKASPASSWFHSIVAPGGGTRYVDTSLATGGLGEAITSADWTPFLRDVVALFGFAGPMELPSVPDGAVEAWIVPADGTEPAPVDPAMVTVHPVMNTVVVDPAVIPAGAAVWLLYLPV
jgi:hypothetical protein